LTHSIFETQASLLHHLPIVKLIINLFYVYVFYMKVNYSIKHNVAPRSFKFISIFFLAKTFRLFNLVSKKVDNFKLNLIFISDKI
jgi:hypothetical protein